MRRDFAFDALNRLTVEAWYDSGGFLTATTTFSYDANGKQLTAQNGSGAYTMSYDALNRVTVANEPFGKTLTFSYDAAGHRTKVEDSLGGVTTSLYDGAGRLTSQQLGGTGQ